MLLWNIEELMYFPALAAKVALSEIKKSTRISQEKLYYGPHPQQYMLLFYDTGSKIQRKNSIFFVHGGAWCLGNPTLFRFIGRYFASLGFPAILPGYRLAPKHKYPAQNKDMIDALKTGIAALKERKLFKDSLIAAGQSAGAQLAGCLTYQRNNFLKNSIDPNIIKGFISISGPLDLTIPKSSIGKKLLNAYTISSENWSKVSPINFIQGNENIPVLCIHGDRDPIVSVSNSVNIISKVNHSKNNLAKLYIAKGTHHCDLCVNLFLNKDQNCCHVLNTWLEEREL
ncbi:MAG: alpha/beta hydrolase [Clostridia bacterium]|nr:alpha/beta hydrolase [Clostridia bacterium]